MNKYDDIINISRWEPQNHARMSLKSRASQFAPFAALSGHDAAIKKMTILDEITMEILNKKLSFLIDNIEEHPMIEVHYCLREDNKGDYIQHVHNGKIRRIEDFENMVVFEDGKIVSIPSIFDIKGDFPSDIDEQY